MVPKMHDYIQCIGGHTGKDWKNPSCHDILCNVLESIKSIKWLQKFVVMYNVIAYWVLNIPSSSCCDFLWYTGEHWSDS